MLLFPALRKAKRISKDHELYLIEDVPVFCEYTRYDDDFGKKEKISADDLNKIVERMRFFGPAAIIIGHTGDDNQYNEEEAVGLAFGFRVSDIDGKKYLVCDFLVRDPDILNRYPRRSVELWDDYTIDPIALLGSSTPKLDLPVTIVKYHRRKYKMDENIRQIIEQVLAAIKNTSEWKFLSQLQNEWESFQESLGSQKDLASIGGQPTDGVEKQIDLRNGDLAELPSDGVKHEQLSDEEIAGLANILDEIEPEELAKALKDNGLSDEQINVVLKDIYGQENREDTEGSSSSEESDNEEDKNKDNEKREDEEDDTKLVEKLLEEYFEQDESEGRDSERKDKERNVEKHQAAPGAGPGPYSSFIPGHVSTGRASNAGGSVKIGGKYERGCSRKYKVSKDNEEDESDDGKSEQDDDKRFSVDSEDVGEMGVGRQEAKKLVLDVISKAIIENYDKIYGDKDSSSQDDNGGVRKYAFPLLGAILPALAGAAKAIGGALGLTGLAKAAGAAGAAKAAGLAGAAKAAGAATGLTGAAKVAGLAAPSVTGSLSSAGTAGAAGAAGLSGFGSGLGTLIRGIGLGNVAKAVGRYVTHSLREEMPPAIRSEAERLFSGSYGSAPVARAPVSVAAGRPTVAVPDFSVDGAKAPVPTSPNNVVDKLARDISSTRDREVEELKRENEELRRMYRRERRRKIFDALYHDGYYLDVDEELKNVENLDDNAFVDYVHRIRKYYRKAPVADMRWVRDSLGVHSGSSIITQEMKDKAVEYATIKGLTFEQAIQELYGTK